MSENMYMYLKFLQEGHTFLFLCLGRRWAMTVVAALCEWNEIVRVTVLQARYDTHTRCSWKI